MGSEDQLHLHYAMFVRNMICESLAHTKQCKELGQSRHEMKGFSKSSEFLSGMATDGRGLGHGAN